MKTREYAIAPVAGRECLRYAVGDRVRSHLCMRGVHKWLASHYPRVTFEGETEDKYRNYKDTGPILAT